jgi:hypothetical protein
MWRSFLELHPDDREAALAGDPDAINRLAGVFLTWFSTKVGRRFQGEHITDEQVRLVSGFVARFTRGSGQPHYHRQQWIDACAGASVFSAFEAARFYGEALSGGLIIRSELARWRWRHAFVEDFLTQFQAETSTVQ